MISTRRSSRIANISLIYCHSIRIPYYFCSYLWPFCFPDIQTTVSMRYISSAFLYKKKSTIFIHSHSKYARSKGQKRKHLFKKKLYFSVDLAILLVFTGQPLQGTRSFIPKSVAVSVDSPANPTSISNLMCSKLSSLSSVLTYYFSWSANMS